MKIRSRKNRIREARLEVILTSKQSQFCKRTALEQKHLSTSEFIRSFIVKQTNSAAQTKSEQTWNQLRVRVHRLLQSSLSESLSLFCSGRRLSDCSVFISCRVFGWPQRAFHPYKSGHYWCEKKRSWSVLNSACYSSSWRGWGSVHGLEEDYEHLFLVCDGLRISWGMALRAALSRVLTSAMMNPLSAPLASRSSLKADSNWFDLRMSRSSFWSRSAKCSSNFGFTSGDIADWMSSRMNSCTEMLLKFLAWYSQNASSLSLRRTVIIDFKTELFFSVLDFILIHLTL